MASNRQPIWISTVGSAYNKQRNGKKQHKITAGTELQFEIECPRCFEIMALCSNFDTLYYFCEECNFHLYTHIAVNATTNHVLECNKNYNINSNMKFKLYQLW